MQGMLGALGHQRSTQVVCSATQRGVAAVSSSIPRQHSGVQTGHTALQLERAQVPHLPPHFLNEVLQPVWVLDSMSLYSHSKSSCQDKQLCALLHHYISNPSNQAVHDRVNKCCLFLQ